MLCTVDVCTNPETDCNESEEHRIAFEISHGCRIAVAGLPLEIPDIDRWFKRDGDSFVVDFSCPEDLRDSLEAIAAISSRTFFGVGLAMMLVHPEPISRSNFS